MGLLDTIFGKRTFFLRNEDTGQTLQGQYHAENLNKSVKSRYAENASLNMATPFSQFISGELDKITFQATFWNRDEVFGSAEDDIETLFSWVKRDSKFGRPPICSFSAGDGHVSMVSCRIDSVNANFTRPTVTGKLKGVTTQITLVQYKEYSLNNPDPGETRYHRVKDGEYYELLTYIEYGSPEIGDVIRKRHPDKLELKVGDIVKLPSIEAIRTERVEQKSDTFKTSTGNRDTEQRRLRIYMLEKRNRTYTTHIL